MTDPKHHQELVETGRVTRVAFAPEHTAAPTLPEVGDAINWDAESPKVWELSDWGWTEDDFEVTPVEGDPLVVRPANFPNAVAEYRDAAGIQQLTIPTYEAGAKIYGWATNMVKDGQWYEEQAAHVTRKAMIIETHGLGVDYFPSCEIRVPRSAMGYRTLTQDNIIVRPFGTEDVPTGHQWGHYGEETSP